MGDYKISIIIPVYNCEMYLQSCLDSVEKQTYLNYEVILVDDGSEDRSGKLCDDFALNKTSVKVIHQKNSGAAMARKVGIAAAEGDYITFIDSDDFIEATYLENLIEPTNTYDVDMIVGTYKWYLGQHCKQYKQYFACGYYDKKRLNREVYGEMLSTSLLPNFGIIPAMWGKLYKKQIVINNIDSLNHGIIYGEDGCFTYAALLDCNAIYISEDSGYIWRYNTESVTNHFNLKLIADGVKLKKYYLSLIEKKNWNVNTQLDEYLANVCNYIITNAVRSSNNSIKINEALKVCVEDVFPKKFEKNKKFKKAPLKLRIQYFLISRKAFGILKIYLKL